MQLENKKGPRQEPWGTPLVTCTTEKRIPRHAYKVFFLSLFCTKVSGHFPVRTSDWTPPNWMCLQGRGCWALGVISSFHQRHWKSHTEAYKRTSLERFPTQTPVVNFALRLFFLEHSKLRNKYRVLKYSTVAHLKDWRSNQGLTWRLYCSSFLDSSWNFLPKLKCTFSACQPPHTSDLRAAWHALQVSDGRAHALTLQPRRFWLILKAERPVGTHCNPTRSRCASMGTSEESKSASITQQHNHLFPPKQTTRLEWKMNLTVYLSCPEAESWCWSVTPSKCWRGGETCPDWSKWAV